MEDSLHSAAVRRSCPPWKRTSSDRPQSQTRPRHRTETFSVCMQSIFRTRTRAALPSVAGLGLECTMFQVRPPVSHLGPFAPLIASSSLLFLTMNWTDVGRCGRRRDADLRRFRRVTIIQARPASARIYWPIVPLPCIPLVSRCRRRDRRWRGAARWNRGETKRTIAAQLLRWTADLRPHVRTHACMYCHSAGVTGPSPRNGGRPSSAVLSGDSRPSSACGDQ